MEIPDKILIVDDDIILGESMVKILESVGHQAEMVNNGKAAKAKI